MHYCVLRRSDQNGSGTEWIDEGAEATRRYRTGVLQKPEGAGEDRQREDMRQVGGDGGLFQIDTPD